jgi:hypothetical protein
MPKDSVFTVKIESDLRAAFIAEAEAAHRPASQLVRDYMRDFIAERRAARAHDAWFRGQVEEGERQADDATIKRIPIKRSRVIGRPDEPNCLKKQASATGEDRMVAARATGS